MKFINKLKNLFNKPTKQTITVEVTNMNILINTLVRESKGKFLTIDFVKSNGEVRKINGRIGVDGADYRKDSSDGSKYLLVWEPATRGYRRVNLNTVMRIASQGSVLYVAK